MVGMTWFRNSVGREVASRWWVIQGGGRALSKAGVGGAIVPPPSLPLKGEGPIECGPESVVSPRRDTSHFRGRWVGVRGSRLGRECEPLTRRYAPTSPRRGEA